MFKKNDLFLCASRNVSCIVNQLTGDCHWLSRVDILNISISFLLSWFVFLCSLSQPYMYSLTRASYSIMMPLRTNEHHSNLKIFYFLFFLLGLLPSLRSFSCSAVSWQSILFSSVLFVDMLLSFCLFSVSSASPILSTSINITDSICY